MGLTFVLWISALRLSRNTAQVSGLIFLAPFLSLVWIHQVLGEAIHPSTLVGLVLIVGGIILVQRATRVDSTGAVQSGHLGSPVRRPSPLRFNAAIQGNLSHAGIANG